MSGALLQTGKTLKALFFVAALFFLERLLGLLRVRMPRDVESIGAAGGCHRATPCAQQVSLDDSSASQPSLCATPSQKVNAASPRN